MRVKQNAAEGSERFCIILSGVQMGFPDLTSVFLSLECGAYGDGYGCLEIEVERRKCHLIERAPMKLFPVGIDRETQVCADMSSTSFCQSGLANAEAAIC